MSNPKKLDISYEELIEIAKALNQNTISNRSRAKEDKISTDKFIRQKFNVSRKNFSFTIKDTDIKYNTSTFLYDMPKVNELKVNLDNTKVDSKINNVSEGNTKVNLQKNKVHKSTTKVNECSNVACKEIIQLEDEKVHKSNGEVYLQKQKVNQSNIFSIPEEFKEIIPLSSDLKDMVKWWKNQKNSYLIDIHTPRIDLKHPKLTGNVTTKSYKVYEEVANDFGKFAAKKKASTKETIKDLVSLALIEFMDKYKE